MPLRLSAGVIERATEAQASVTVRVNDREATGRGSIYLSDVWAWPDPNLDHDHRDGKLRALCDAIAGDLVALCGGEPAHPLSLGLRLHDAVCEGDQAWDVPSILARAMCLSPFDAAIHDAAGLALGISAFDFYTEDDPLPEADSWFDGDGACASIGAFMLTQPRKEFEAWWAVSKDESLDGAFANAVRERGYRCFKLKTTGRDIESDALRTAEVYRAARSLGTARPRLVVDSNEATPDAAAVLSYLHCLRAVDENAFAAVDYLEQPTGRDIQTHRFDWRDVTALKPVVLDEGLTSLSLLPEALAQGWSGLALKTCKGHSTALTAAAWANRNNMLISLQDLTNPGLAAIHAALFAAHVPMINGVELNSPQFTPAANQAWQPRLGGLLQPTGGVHRLPDAKPCGLGSQMYR